MGWTSFYKTHGKSVVDTIKDELGVEWLAKHFVAASATREAVFIVAKMAEPDSKTHVPDADGTIRVILVFKYRMTPRSHYNFFYKDMDETSGPVGCYAPMSIIAQASPLRTLEVETTDYSPLQAAITYRRNSEKHAAQVKLKRSLKVGDKLFFVEPLSYGGLLSQNFTVMKGRIRGRKGNTTYFYSQHGQACLITADTLTKAEITRV